MLHVSERTLTRFNDPARPSYWIVRYDQELRRQYGNAVDGATECARSYREGHDMTTTISEGQ